MNPDDLVTLWFDDEEAGGSAAWAEQVPPGAIPEKGDWVWNHDPKNGRVGRYSVLLKAWTFVEPGSADGLAGRWAPQVRVHLAYARHQGGGAPAASVYRAPDGPGPERARDLIDEVTAEHARTWRPAGSPPLIRGSVVDAGGGQVQILVDRDTRSYPAVGAVVTVRPADLDETGDTA